MADPKDLRPERLLARLEALEERIKRLEAERAPSPYGGTWPSKDAS